MKLRSLKIQGFRSFKAEEEIKFPDGTGFFFLTGVNELHPELGANGTGKSSTWDAVSWVFFGKTARGLKAGNAANWDREHLCRGALVFRKDDVDYEVTRTWDPITLNIQELTGDDVDDPKPITQEELEKLIGCDHTTFMNTVVMGQFGQYFFDLSPTEKLDIFSKLFELQFWLERSALASKKSNEYAAEAQKLEVEIGRHKGALEATNGQLSLAEIMSKNFNDSMAKQIDELEKAQITLDNAEATLLKEGKKLSTANTEAQTAYDVAVSTLADIDKEIHEIQHPALSTARSAHATAAAEEKRLAAEGARIKSLGAGECPTCYGVVTKEHIAKVFAQIEKTWNDARDVKIGCQAKLDKAIIKMEKAETLRSECSKALKAAETLKINAFTALNEARRSFDKAKSDAARGRTSLADKRAQKNPFGPQIESLTTKLEALTDECAAQQEALKKAERLKDRYAFWIKGYKDLRLWLIERALIDFEVCVNNSLADLGLAGWSVKFDVERTNTTGGVSKGFTVLIQSPDHPEPMPFDAWSGGETQRLRIAGSIGLSDLIRNWRGFDPSIEVWDEPTAHLSREGISDLLRFFKVRSRQTKKQIWLVDHRSPGAGDFDGSFCVTLNQSGSHISGGLTDGGE